MVLCSSIAKAARPFDVLLYEPFCLGSVLFFLRCEKVTDVGSREHDSIDTLVVGHKSTTYFDPEITSILPVSSVLVTGRRPGNYEHLLTCHAHLEQEHLQ